MMTVIFYAIVSCVCVISLFGLIYTCAYGWHMHQVAVAIYELEAQQLAAAAPSAPPLPVMVECVVIDSGGSLYAGEPCGSITRTVRG
jgi:hypothetical protein